MLAYYGPEWESLASRIVGRWCPSLTGNTQLQLPSTMGRNHCNLLNFASNANLAYVNINGKTALDFDGVNDHALLVDPPQVLYTMPFSVSLWASCRTTTAVSQPFGFGNSSTLNQLFSIQFRGDVAGDPIQAQMRGSSSSSNTFAVFPGPYVANQIYHIVAVFTSASSRTIFVDGVQGTTDTNTYAVLPLNRMSIGALVRTSVGPHNGHVDDVTIFNAALTANEVQFIYDQGRGGGLLYQPPRRRSVAAVIAALVLACETANYSLTGQAAGLFASRSLAADQAQYILSGNAANTTASRLLSADPASYTATGNEAATICARLLDGGAAAYALTGTDAGLIANRKLTADQAVCFLAGNNAELLRSLKLNAGSMALQIDNFAASLLADRKISADGAEYILVVSDANLTGSASGVAPYYYLFMMRGPQ
jgi:hypothetical protein